MPNRVTVTIRGKPVVVLAGSKSDIARGLLGAGYTVSEIAKAVPMAYSQVHSIWKKGDYLQDEAPRRPDILVAKARAEQKDTKRFEPEPFAGSKAADSRRQAALKRAQTKDATRKGDAIVAKVLDRERANEQAGRPAGPSLRRKGGGKLRVGALPRDTDAGECANCGFQIVVRPTPHGYVLVHTGASVEDFHRIIQFCQAVRKKLI